MSGKRGPRRASLDKIAASKLEVLEAERLLDAALHDIPLAPRGNKVRISDAVEEALRRLKAARVGLSELEELLVQAETAHDPE